LVQRLRTDGARPSMASPYMVLWQIVSLRQEDQRGGISSNIPSSTVSVSIAGGEDTGNEECVDQVGESSDG